MRHLRGLLAFTVLSLLLTMLPTPGLASSIVVDPIKENINVEPGALTDLQLTLTNNTESAKAVGIGFAEFTVDNDGVPTVVDTPSATAPAGWFSASESTFTLAVGESKSVTVQVDVPLDLPSQGYYVMAISRIQNADPEVASTTTAQELYTLYSVTVGAPEETLEILQLSPSTRSVQITLRNPANVHTTASGKVDVYVGEQIDATYTVTPVNIFPGKSRSTTIAFDEVPGENYEARVTLAYGRNNQIITKAALFPEDVEAEILDDERVQSHAVRNNVEVVATEDTGKTVLYGVASAGTLLAAVGLAFIIRRR